MAAPPALVRRLPARTAHPRGTDAHEPPASSGQKLGSYPRSRRGGRRPGGGVAGAGLDDVSRVGTGAGRFSSAGRSTSPSLRGTLEGGEGASWRRTVSAGGVRAGANGGRGLGTIRSNSVAMAALTTPTSSPRAAATSLWLGRPGRSRSGFRVIHRRRRGRALHSLRACRWRSSAAAFLLTQAAASQSDLLGRATDHGCRLPVDLLEDRPLSRRRRRPGPDRLGNRDDGSVASGMSPHSRAAA